MLQFFFTCEEQTSQYALCSIIWYRNHSAQEERGKRRREEMREERELGPSAHLRQTLLGRQCIEPHDGQNGD